MSKELNLVEILKDCPKGMKLWSPCWGELIYDGINWKEYEAWDSETEDVYPIRMIWADKMSFTPYGRYVIEGDVMIYPSKDNRDWSTFKVPKPKWNPDTLQPFDKVLVRDADTDYWGGDFYLYTDKETGSDFPYSCVASNFKICIPYNEDTKHLLGTNQKAPEFYRI